MNIRPMLVRLEGALECSNIAERMILIAKPTLNQIDNGPLNLVVGYDSSPRSQIALDVALWIAYQTRVATSCEVTVQVVYVVESEAPTQTSTLDLLHQQESAGGVPSSLPDSKQLRDIMDVRQRHRSAQGFDEARLSMPIAPKLASSGGQAQAVKTPPTQAEQFAQADRILWQARCLADEWRGSLKTHLRWGQVATELREVVEEESGTLLIIGCETAEAELIQALGMDFPCPVIGIPPELQDD
ncbi:MAG: universal stress protein [Thainema sp.]